MGRYGLFKLGALKRNVAEFMSELVKNSDITSKTIDAGIYQQFIRYLQSVWRSIIVFIPYVWLLVFFLFPFFIIAKISVAELVYASPPFSKMIEWTDGSITGIRIIWDNFIYIWEEDLYYRTYFNSLKISIVSTIICLLIGYPIAYGITRSGPLAKKILLFAVILPFWTSFLLRVYAWWGLLADQGPINSFFNSIGLISLLNSYGWIDGNYIPMSYSHFAVFVGVVYTYLPFMILPLYANMEKLDLSLNEAAADLGSRPSNTFFKVTLPLTIPGIIAGSLLVFIPATGEYVIPDLLGGGNVPMIGRQLYNDFTLPDWPLASAVAVVLLFLLVLPMGVYQYYQAKATEEA